jgi:hypothetical protein
LKGLAPGDLPGTSAATVRSCVQELFSGGRANTQIFAQTDHLNLTFERSTRTRGQAHLPSINREEIEGRLLQRTEFQL